MDNNKTVTGPTSLKISVEELSKLVKYINEKNLKKVPVTNIYELLRVKDKNISIILYKSGKLVHNNTIDSIDVIKNVIYSPIKYDYMLGSDETGKGEWYGPLVACCVALNSDQIDAMRLLGVQDSKLIKKEKIVPISDEIIKLQPIYRTRIIMPETYNKMYNEFLKENKNLNDLLAWAHTASIKDVLKKLNYNQVKLVIDKFDEEKTYGRLLNIDKNKVEIIQKSKGESEIPVAAASIIAKRAFELTVDDLNKKYEVDLRKISPESLDKKILTYVSKTHFKNIEKLL